MKMLQALLLECQVAVQDFTQVMTYLIRAKILKVCSYICIMCTHNVANSNILLPIFFLVRVNVQFDLFFNSVDAMQPISGANRCL